MTQALPSCQSMPHGAAACHLLACPSQASTVGLARQGKVVDLAWLPLPGSVASVLVMAGEDGQLSFLDAAHSAAQQIERARGQAFRSLPGSGRPLPLVRPCSGVRCAGSFQDWQWQQQITNSTEGA